MGGRGVIGDKWSLRILWACAIGSAIGLYMVAVERQAQNRERAMAQGLIATEVGSDGNSSAEEVIAYFRSSLNQIAIFLRNAAKLRYFYGHLLEGCRVFLQVNQIHAQILVNGFHRDKWLLAKLINGLMATGEQQVASAVFNQVDHPDGFLWTWMIRAYSCYGPAREAITFYDRMRRSCVHTNNFSFPFALKSCAALGALLEGEQMHADVMKLGFLNDMFVQTALMDMYAKCSRIGLARQVFDNMKEKSVVSWTAILAGYCRHGLLEKAQKLFHEIPARNVVTWNAMIDGLTRFGDMESARCIFNQMPQRNLVSWTIMIGGYSRSGDVANARQLFDQVVNREVVTWTAMISCYAQNGEPGEAVRLFQAMLSEDMKPDEVTMLAVISAVEHSASLHLCAWIEDCIHRFGFRLDVRLMNAVMNMHVQCGCIERAFLVFEKMPERNTISYNTMITGCALHGNAKGALEMFSKMIQEEVRPNSITFVGVLTACAHGGLVDEGRRYFRMMLDLGYVEVSREHYSCMVDMLGRGGHLDEAHELVSKMAMKTEESSSSTWGALLGACRIHGNLELAEVVARRLFQLEPDNPGNYAILANMYAEAKMWEAARSVRELMRHRQLRKTAGRSWVEHVSTVTVDCSNLNSSSMGRSRSYR
ncbi:hypothetical protein ACLOJK_041548 [Asimina triloba]